MVTAYGMGLIALQDCNFRQMLSHSGGYPGYGSIMVLLPEHNTGLFAFTNRTYTAPSRLVMEAAQELLRAGYLPSREVPVSDSLKRMYDFAGDAYSKDNPDGAGPRLAMNFLMDRSAENWAKILAGLKAEVGACQTDSPIVPNGALAGGFEWQCERGKIQGQLLLAPTTPPTIQALRFRAVPNQPAG